MIEQDTLSQARRRVEAIKGFYIHLVVFFLVIALLLAINSVGSSAWWVQWPALVGDRRARARCRHLRAVTKRTGALGAA